MTKWREMPGVVRCTRSVRSASEALTEATRSSPASDASSVDGWSDLVDGTLVIGGIDWGLVAGTSDTTLTVTPNAQGSVALPQVRVRARIANDCSTLVTRPTTVSVCQCLDCPADFNQDGGVDGGDINAFFATWESGGCDGDVNADGGVDAGDVNTFFIAWESGGC